MAIDVSVKVSFLEDSLGGIKVTEDKEFTDDKEASLYLALTDGAPKINVAWRIIPKK